MLAPSDFSTLETLSDALSIHGLEEGTMLAGGGSEQSTHELFEFLAKLFTVIRISSGARPDRYPDIGDLNSSWRDVASIFYTEWSSFEMEEDLLSVSITHEFEKLFFREGPVPVEFSDEFGAEQVRQFVAVLRKVDPRYRQHVDEVKERKRQAEEEVAWERVERKKASPSPGRGKKGQGEPLTAEDRKMLAFLSISLGGLHCRLIY